MDTQLIYRALTRASDEHLIEELESRGFICLSDDLDSYHAEKEYERKQINAIHEKAAAPQRQGAFVLGFHRPQP